MSAVVLPEQVETGYRRALEQFREQNPLLSDWLNERLNEPHFSHQLAVAWGCSEFITQTCQRHGELFRELVDSGDLQAAYPDDRYRSTLAQLLTPVDDEETLARSLRGFRRREMLRIVWRDFNRLTPLLETTRDVSLLAEACIDGALEFLHPRLCSQLGTPKSSAGRSQKLLVLGMGKLGAYELNVSSDIDLIFVYPEAGQTEGGRKPLSNQEFFLRLGQKLIAALDQQTADGFVFRVDMRLRPYGQSGALVLNFDALEEYYQTQGREWERYAMIKARVVSGDADDAAELAAMLRPFTYRRYIDYGAIEALRELKQSINREVARKGLRDNIKLGPGGIREVEFIAQAFQLIRGGRDNRLQTQSLRAALDVLKDDQAFSAEELDGLWTAYEFLRNSEHALQGMADRQTQVLPGDNLSRQRLALVMECADWSDYRERLESHRQLVARLFSEVVTDPDRQQEVLADRHREMQGVWRRALPADALLKTLTDAGYDDAQEVTAQLDDLRSDGKVRALQKVPRARLDALMPRLLGICADLENSGEALQRVLRLVQAVLRRSAYLALLVENPQALQQLVILCARSSWVADELCNYPALLDELLDPRELFTPPDKGMLRDALRRQVLRIPGHDLEAQMDSIRYFCRSHQLRVAACEMTEVLPLMRVSDYLTWLAEVVVEHVVDLAWEQMLEKYGQPGANGGPQPGFIAVGYGKLGGIELGYSSDLDLVFLHDADANLHTEGERSIDNGTFFTRLGQRVIHMLSTRTASGLAYEIDMRLRPSGNSGMLVTSLDAFEKYQMENAWTWEHQALVRARVVAGNLELADRFADVRKRVLCLERESEKLRADVVAMRDKMREHLTRRHGDNVFALKQDRGGIVDIEFMVQFAVLNWARQHPELARWSDNVRILETLAEQQLLPVQEARQLIDSYLAYRSAGHGAQLQKQPDEVEAAAFASQRDAVIALWRKLVEYQ